MSCQVVACPISRVHHHHVRAGVRVPTPCFCTRPEQIEAVTLEQLLDFAAAHPGKVDGRTGELVREQLHITPVRYIQLLGQVIDSEEALAYDPLTTYRLRREAAHRASAREARNGR